MRAFLSFIMYVARVKLIIDVILRGNLIYEFRSSFTCSSWYRTYCIYCQLLQSSCHLKHKTCFITNCRYWLLYTCFYFVLTNLSDIQLEARNMRSLNFRLEMEHSGFEISPTDRRAMHTTSAQYTGQSSFFLFFPHCFFPWFGGAVLPHFWILDRL